MPIVVFDWDGTLCDSEYLDHVAAYETSVQLGFTQLAETLSAQMFVQRGTSLPLLALRRLPAQHRDAWLQRFRKRFAVLDGSAPLFPEVSGVLRALHDAGWRLAIASRRSRNGLEAGVVRTGLLGRFDLIVSADDVPPKPAPDALVCIAQTLRQDVGDAVMVGNDPDDEAMAGAAGCRFVPVRFCYRTRDPMPFAPGSGAVRAVPELLAHIRALQPEYFRTAIA